MSARSPDEPRVQHDLVDLSASDEAVAAEAFARLWSVALPPALRFLARRGVERSDAEDIAQGAAAELWERRRSVRARCAGEWLSLVRTAAARHGSRHARENRLRTLSLDEAAIPPEDLPYLDEIAVLAHERHRLRDEADSLWLGEARSPDASLGAIALRLFLVDGLSREDVEEMFGTGSEDLERWLQDPGVLSRALFSSLCWPSDALAGYVLRPERPLTTSDLDGIPRGALPEGIAGWSANEAVIVCLRLRNGLREEEIDATGVEPTSVPSVLERVRAALPYRGVARGLLLALDSRGAARALCGPDLWKRIAFDYYARGLPHRQIVERAGPPAEEAHFRLDETKLNNWLSGGRLFAQLASRIQERSR